ncbi:MAG: NAD(P)/FAD-dependent oxidoreductase [Myxococcota bacterium]
MQFDVVIVGAGLSGLAAGIRLAQYEKKVLILEKHYLWGGLNSFYKRSGHLFDVGLHALTNWAEPDAPKGRRNPLQRVLRQLRLRREDLDLVPQGRSSIRVGGEELVLTNDFEAIVEEVARLFPGERDGFVRLAQDLESYPAAMENRVFISSRERLQDYLHEPLLIEMLLCPMFFYGNAKEHDIDWWELGVLFNSILREGLGRPSAGMRPFLAQLRQRFSDLGGELWTRSAVQAIHSKDDGVAVEITGKGTVHGRSVLSSAGSRETERLLGRQPTERDPRLGFAETIWVLDRPLAELGFEDCVTFFSHGDRMIWEDPETDVDLRSGVLCCPNNYPDASEPKAPILRATHLASSRRWFDKSEEQYGRDKEAFVRGSTESVSALVGPYRPHVRFTDAFTPRTIHRFTGHEGGAIYGAPRKHRNAETGSKGVYLIGTDQGMSGIVGAMLSGVTVANERILRV